MRSECVDTSWFSRSHRSDRQPKGQLNKTINATHPMGFTICLTLCYWHQGLFRRLLRMTQALNCSIFHLSAIHVPKFTIPSGCVVKLYTRYCTAEAVRCLEAPGNHLVAQRPTLWTRDLPLNLDFTGISWAFRGISCPDFYSYLVL